MMKLEMIADLDMCFAKLGLPLTPASFLRLAKHANDVKKLICISLFNSEHHQIIY